MQKNTESNLFHWLDKIVSEATNKGWKCVPAKDGSPLVRWADDRSFPFPSDIWSNANQIGLVLNRTVLIDFDGKVELSTLFEKIGVTSDFMRDNLFQWRSGRSDSLHWLFKLPDFVKPETHYHNQDGTLLDGVDIKCMAQLVYLKPDKVLRLPAYNNLPEAPEGVIKALERKSNHPALKAKIPERIMFDANVKVLDRIKAIAADAPLYWYEQLGQITDKTGHSGCPLCGGRHRFSVLPNGRFRCADCLPRGGSIVDFLQWRDGIDLREVKRILTQIMTLY